MTWAASAVVAVTAAGSAYSAYNNQKKGSGTVGPARPWSPMTAGNTQISPDLKNIFGGIGTNASNSIANNYKQLAERQANDSAIRGIPSGPNAGSYGAQRLGAQQEIDQGNLESAIGGGEGSAAYSDALSARGYGQGSDLASQIARLNKPSVLDQVFQGIGAVGPSVSAYYGARKKTPSSSPLYSSGGGTSYDINNPGPLDLGYNWSQ